MVWSFTLSARPVQVRGSSRRESVVLKTFFVEPLFVSELGAKVEVAKLTPG
jgi:hypothetical protein